MDATRRAPRPTMLVAILSLGALLASCGSGSTPRATVSHDLVQASTGLCQALGDLPDALAASRTFTNEAHDPLHLLAADEQLERSLQASVLEAMQQVEADFGQGAGEGVLYGHLATLKDRTDAALAVLGEEAPACDH